MIIRTHFNTVLLFNLVISAVHTLQRSFTKITTNHCVLHEFHFSTTATLISSSFSVTSSSNKIRDKVFRISGSRQHRIYMPDDSSRNLHVCNPLQSLCRDTPLHHPKFRYLMVSGNISKTHNWERDTVLGAGRYLDCPGPISIRIISSGFDAFCTGTNRSRLHSVQAAHRAEIRRYCVSVRCKPAWNRCLNGQMARFAPNSSCFGNCWSVSSDCSIGWTAGGSLWLGRNVLSGSGLSLGYYWERIMRFRWDGWAAELLSPSLNSDLTYV